MRNGKKHIIPYDVGVLHALLEVCLFELLSIPITQLHCSLSYTFLNNGN